MACPKLGFNQIDPAEVFEGTSTEFSVVTDGTLVDGPSLGFAIQGGLTPPIYATGVHLVNENTIAGTVDIPYESAGDYRILLVNGCGSATFSDSFPLTVDTKKNLTFDTKGDALDIAVDSTSGDFLVLFNDLTVRDTFAIRSIRNLPLSTCLRIRRWRKSVAHRTGTGS